MVHTDFEWETAQEVVRNALRETPYVCQSLERLPGGFINFTFRNILSTPIDGHRKTVVVKMTEDKLKIEKTTGEEFTLHKTRSYYEHQVLSRQLPSYSSDVAQDGSTSVLVRVPEFLEYIPSNYLQIIEDLPNTSTLKAHLVAKSMEPSFARTCGKSVGAWAVEFHKWGRHLDQESLRNVLSNYEEAGIFKYRLSCGRLDATVEKFPDVLNSKKVLFRQVSERIATITHGDDLGIMHGDFWPGNLVFAGPTDGENSASDVDLKPKQLIFVLDWELCHLSSIAIDLGTMFAELYILYLFEDSVSVPLILESFIEAYGSIDIQDAYDTMMYCGVHLIIWPCRTEWSKSPKLMECINYGCDILQNAHGANSYWFKEGLFGKLFVGGDAWVEAGK